MHHLFYLAVVEPASREIWLGLFGIGLVGLWLASWIRARQDERHY